MVDQMLAESLPRFRARDKLKFVAARRSIETHGGPFVDFTLRLLRALLTAYEPLARETVSKFFCEKTVNLL